jgi:hypothetical protein
MVLPENLELAKSELDSVLRSGLFTHAPSLVKFLSYVCAKSFEGKTDQIKEYNIAVEALGRKTPEYDQKKDSIVRVEAHRLRKRLRHYYASEGANHAVQILIPPGQYVPQFLTVTEPANGLECDAVEEASPSVDGGAIAGSGRKSTAVLLWAGAAVVVLVAAMLIGWRLAAQIWLTAR